MQRKRWLRRLISASAIGIWSFLLTSLFLFGLLEAFPQLGTFIDVTGIKYYSYSTIYRHDDSLAFIPRVNNLQFDSIKKGDLYSPELEQFAEGFRYSGSTNELGFRSNTSTAPWDVALIGDSYLEFGEDNPDTLAERVRSITNLSVANLGRGAYGPHQYVEVLNRYALPLKPKVAVLSLFSGNDLVDIQLYTQWQAGYDYFPQMAIARSAPVRYLFATADTVKFILDSVSLGARRSLSAFQDSTTQTESTAMSEMGEFKIGDALVMMRIRWWDNPPLSSESLQKTASWNKLQYLLSSFAKTCKENEIVPVLLYIPSKIQVYGKFSTGRGGETFKARLPDQLQQEDSFATAAVATAQAAGFQVVNLKPHFDQRAAEGQLLYYPLDSHWNRAGRILGAQVLADSLAK